MEVMRIERALGEPFEVIVLAGATVSEYFGISKATFGTFETPGALTSVACKFLVAHSLGVDFVQCRKGDGTDAAVVVAAGGGYVIPGDVFGHRWCKLSFGTAEAAERAISISLGN